MAYLTDPVTGEWRQDTEDEWVATLYRYYAVDPMCAIKRARKLAYGDPWDFDDNTPRAWALRFLKEVGCEHLP
jgi:hypothetical protein